jgi:AraC-like DNA-binding protein
MVHEPLSEVIRALELRGGLFLEGRLTAPWSITARVSPEDCRPFMEVPEQVIAYHVVTHGRIVVALEGTPAREVHAGEIVLLPRNDAHQVMSEPGLATDLDEVLVLPPAESGLLRVDHGGGGAEARILCGFLASDGAPSPLLESLPPLLIVALEDVASLGWVEASVRIAARELTRGRLASAAVMSRLAELLLVEALRGYCASEARLSGWLGGMRDPQVGRALALLHTDLARSWTVDALAAEAGMSRTAFVDRFRLLVGAPPIRYLGHARLAAARALLRETRLTTSEIAYRVGFEAPVAFNRAFKRAFGLPPAAWRDLAARGAAPTS